jgi:Fe2+ or Zn2+ uptake regulation protein
MSLKLSKKGNHVTTSSITEYISDVLKNAGQRMTVQRKGLIEVLESTKVSLSIKEIFQKLSDKKFKIDEASVYRIIEALKELNLVHIYANGKVKLCSHLACKQTFHLSLECQKCKKVQEPHLDPKRELQITKTLNLKTNSIKHLHIDYICENCA